MTETRHRIAALVLAAMLATVGTVAASATFAAGDAHALVTTSTSVDN